MYKVELRDVSCSGGVEYIDTSANSQVILQSKLSWKSQIRESQCTSISKQKQSSL